MSRFSVRDVLNFLGVDKGARAKCADGKTFVYRGLVVGTEAQLRPLYNHALSNTPRFPTVGDGMDQVFVMGVMGDGFTYYGGEAMPIILRAQTGSAARQYSIANETWTYYVGDQLLDTIPMKWIRDATREQILERLNAVRDAADAVRDVMTLTLMPENEE